MNYIKYIILGIIQGLTEPLPISSSGHIFLFKNIFGTEFFNTLNFEIISNFGSFLAILFIFKKDIIKLINDFFKYIIKKDKNSYKENYMYAIKLIISTIPAGIAGLLLSDYLEKNFTSLKYLSLAFLLTAFILLLIRNPKGKKTIKDISIKDSIIIGLFQMIAIIPGISRSGFVLSACLLCKIKKEDALKYTFMLYLPVSIGSFIIKINDIFNSPSQLLLPYLFGMISSLIVTYYSYKWLSNIVKNNNLYKFSIYCLIIVLFILIYFR